jgi:hypothetical protein
MIMKQSVNLLLSRGSLRAVSSNLQFDEIFFSPYNGELLLPP